MTNIRLVLTQDLPEVLKLFQHAREFMVRTGNPNQWKDYHPQKELIEGDIANQTGYVIVDDNVIVGYFALLFGEDPTYHDIDGKWLNDLPYATIHRLGSNGKRSGIFIDAVNFAFTKINNIRIDTHRKNIVMLNLFKKYDFIYCGIVRIGDGTERIVYQKYLD